MGDEAPYNDSIGEILIAKRKRTWRLALPLQARMSCRLALWEI